MPLRKTGFEWEVPGKVVHVVAGNIVVCDLDLGWSVSVRARVQVLGLEIMGNELAARKQAQMLLPPDTPLVVLCRRVYRDSRVCDAEIAYGPGFSPRSDEGSFVLAMLAAGVAKRAS